VSTGGERRVGMDTKLWSGETKWGGCCLLSPQPPGARQHGKAGRGGLCTGKLLVSQLAAEGSSCCQRPWYCHVSLWLLGDRKIVTVFVLVMWMER